jgi:hypothetical protein
MFSSIPTQLDISRSEPQHPPTLATQVPAKTYKSASAMIIYWDQESVGGGSVTKNYFAGELRPTFEDLYHYTVKDLPTLRGVAGGL